MISVRAIGAVLLIASVFSFTEAVSAQTLTCAGAHLATQQEANAAPGGAIIAGVTYVCPADAALGISNQVGEAKQYLLSIAQGLSGTQAPPDKDHIDKLNNTFAVCAANFLKAYTQATGVKVILRSAFRCGPASPSNIQCDRTENARAGGAAGSNHMTGLAIDVNPVDGNYAPFWQFASRNPAYGVCFPYLAGDRPHVALAGTGTGEAARCAVQGVMKACSGAPVFNPNAQTYIAGTGSTGSYPTGGTNQTGGTRTSPSYNPFVNPYNPTQQLMTSMYGAGQTPASYPMETPSYPTPTPSPTAIPLPTPTSSIFSVPPPYTSPLNTTSRPATSTRELTTYERLQLIAHESVSSGTSQSAPTSTSAPTQLNADLSDIDLGTNTSNLVQGDLALAPTLAQGSVAVKPIHVTETFSQNAPTVVQQATTGAQTANQSLIIALMTTLRDLLVSFVNVLKSRPSYGFQGAWQSPATDAIYR